MKPVDHLAEAKEVADDPYPDSDELLKGILHALIELGYMARHLANEAVNR